MVLTRIYNDTRKRFYSINYNLQDSLENSWNSEPVSGAPERDPSRENSYKSWSDHNPSLAEYEKNDTSKYVLDTNVSYCIMHVKF